MLTSITSQSTGHHCQAIICQTHYPLKHFPFFLFLKILFIYLREREGKEKEKERNTNVWLPLQHPKMGTWSHNPGMCPDWESNQQPFDSQARAAPLSYTSQKRKVTKHFSFSLYLLSLFISLHILTSTRTQI